MRSPHPKFIPLSFQFHPRCILLLQFVCRLDWYPLSTLQRIHYLLYMYIITLFETTCSAARCTSLCQIKNVRTWKFYINLVSESSKIIISCISAQEIYLYQHEILLFVFLVNKNRKQLSTMAVGYVLCYILTIRYTKNKILCTGYYFTETITLRTHIIVNSRLSS